MRGKDWRTSTRDALYQASRTRLIASSARGASGLPGAAPRARSKPATVSSSSTVLVPMSCRSCVARGGTGGQARQVRASGMDRCLRWRSFHGTNVLYGGASGVLPNTAVDEPGYGHDGFHTSAYID